MGRIMRTHSPLLALLVASALLAPSCFISRTTTNEPLRRAEIDRLVPGQTTAGQVVAVLGAPAEVVQLGTRTAYRYDFIVTKRAGFSIIILSFLNDDTRSDRVWLFFDAADVLTHAGTTLQAADTRYEMPWQDLHAQ
jgi:outer membrane protein assembly factor BamE (lipoprotein component of BamABCDE complex)